MSTYLGRIRRLASRGGLLVPGRNLVVFDDAIVRVRASVLDGWRESAAVMGGGLQSPARAGSRAGAQKNAVLNGLGPDDLVVRHDDNWMLWNREVVAVTLADRSMPSDRRRILTITTADRTFVLRFVRSVNPDDYMIPILEKALGDKLLVEPDVYRGRT